MGTERIDREELAKHAENLGAIKALLSEVEETPLTETWVFFAWGGLLLAGALLHAGGWLVLGMQPRDLFIKLWLPVTALGMIFDFSAHIRYFNRESLPFFSRPMIKNWILGIGVTFSTVVIIFYIVQSGAHDLVPPALLASFALLCFLLGHMMSMQAFILGFVMLAGSILLYLTGLHVQVQSVITAAATGVSLIILGAVQKGRDARRNE